MPNEPILIVDDNATNAKLARIILEDEGFVVRTAGDAAEALQILEQFEPRMILMDVQLPRVDGLELTRRLRADARFSGIWIVALTAYAMKGDDDKAYAAGCDGYLTKPIDPDALPKQVASYLKRER